MRDVRSLDGIWTFATDPHDRGLRDGWSKAPGFDREVAVPSPWQLYGDELRAYAGHAWYHRRFAAEAGDREVALHFDACDYATRVWINGVYLGEHEGGYTPFEFVITPHLRAENDLVLRVSDPRDNSEIPHGKQGSWYTRVSGPWQPVWLEWRDAVHVERVHVTPDCRGERARVTAWVAAPDDTALTITLTDPHGLAFVEASATVRQGRAEAWVPVPDVELWSPESPLLYTAEVRVGGDRHTVRFGMRWLRFENGVIYLNGDPLYIRGALDQAFWPETIYRAPSLEAIEHEIGLAKAMGLNLLRKHIKLEDPRYLDACDRLGMLIWEEPACYAKHTPQARERFTREIEAMIGRDYNHPSIIAWSLYNEEWGLEWRLRQDKDKQAHVRALYAHAKQLDDTRLICDNSGWAHVQTDLNDTHRYFTAPDLIEEWHADLAHCVEKPATNFVPGAGDAAAGVPVIVSEFGVWGLPEVSRILDYYGGRPWWFDAQWAGHTEEFKYPATAERHFGRYGLARVFGDLDGLGVACQLRMMRALKPIIEAMRRRADLAGFVVTELTDIEWESNGWLDYFRRPKAGFERFAWFNAPLVAGVSLDHHNVWHDEAFTGRVWISNHTSRAVSGTLRLAIAGTDLACEVPVAAPPFFSGFVGEPVRLAAPSVERTTRTTLSAVLSAGGETLATNEEEITISPRVAAKPSLRFPIALGGEAQRLAPILAAAGCPVCATPEPGALLVTTTLDAAARAHLRAGGHVLFVAETGEGAPEKDLISFRRLPRGESWDRAASVMFAVPDAFGTLPIGGVLGWELEDVYPHHVVPLSNYLQDFGGRGIELPSNQADVDPAGVLAGYFEGWLGKFGAVVLRMPYEQGQLVVTTLRLLERYGTQPIATQLLHQLAAIAAPVLV